MRHTIRVAVVFGACLALFVSTMGPTAAELTRWEDFGAGWANAGYTHGPAPEGPNNGDGNHAGQVRVASSTGYQPKMIRLKFASRDESPVPVEIWYLWIGCKRPDGTYWSRDVSGQTAAITPPGAVKIYDHRRDGPVIGCHVSMEASTTLYDDVLHHFAVRLQARYERSLS
jgi:hypothetical protein